MSKKSQPERPWVSYDRETIIQDIIKLERREIQPPQFDGQEHYLKLYSEFYTEPHVGIWTQKVKEQRFWAYADTYLLPPVDQLPDLTQEATVYLGQANLCKAKDFVWTFYTTLNRDQSIRELFKNLPTSPTIAMVYTTRKHQVDYYQCSR